jgi:hypothetical protein
MKLSLLFFLIPLQAAFVQMDDSVKFIYFKDKSGVQQKAVRVNANQILIVDGGKMFFVPDDSTLNSLLTLNPHLTLFITRIR